MTYVNEKADTLIILHYKHFDRDIKLSVFLSDKDIFLQYPLVSKTTEFSTGKKNNQSKNWGIEGLQQLFILQGLQFFIFLFLVFMQFSLRLSLKTNEK